MCEGGGGAQKIGVGAGGRRGGGKGCICRLHIPMLVAGGLRFIFCMFSCDCGGTPHTGADSSIMWEWGEARQKFRQVTNAMAVQTGEGGDQSVVLICHTAASH